MKGWENFCSGIKKGLELKTDQVDATYDCFILIYYAPREKNDKKTSCFNDLFIRRASDSGYKVYERGAFSNKRYTKGVPFLKKKMVYTTVRGWTSGRSLPV